MRTSALIAIGCFALLLGEQAALAQKVCPIEAVDAFRKARESDFSFELVSSDASNCRLVESTITVSARAASPAQCLYRVLGHRFPAAGWRIRQLVISGAGVLSGPVPAIVPPATAGGSPPVPVPQPGWLIRVRVPAGQSRIASVRKVIMFGPDCRKAAKAFD